MKKLSRNIALRISFAAVLCALLLCRVSAQTPPIPPLPQVTLKLADTTGIVGDTLTLVCLADENHQHLQILNSNQLSGTYNWEVNDLNDPLSGEIGVVIFPSTPLSQVIPLSGWFSSFGICLVSMDTMAEYYGTVSFENQRLYFTYDTAGNRIRRQKR